MKSFHEFLRSRLEQGGFSTEDALTSFLPLAHQTAGAHAAGRVAPLDGVGALRVETGRIWFPESSAPAPRSAPSRMRVLDPPPSGVEVLSEGRRALEAGGGAATSAGDEIGSRDREIVRPVYLPGYLSWEHAAGHHDPISDVFSLGLILGSLACGLDFEDPRDLESFVTHRRNLFRLNPRLHPVLAKAIAS